MRRRNENCGINWRHTCEVRPFNRSLDKSCLSLNIIRIHSFLHTNTGVGVLYRYKIFNFGTQAPSDYSRKFSCCTRDSSSFGRYCTKWKRVIIAGSKAQWKFPFITRQFWSAVAICEGCAYFAAAKALTFSSKFALIHSFIVNTFCSRLCTAEFPEKEETPFTRSVMNSLPFYNKIQYKKIQGTVLAPRPILIPQPSTV